MGRSAVRHVSVRVPWHDSGWNGRVCQDPRANSPCLALRRNAENRDDAYEAENAGRCFSELEVAPPCLAERGTFLSPKPLSLLTRLDYSNYSEHHRHILPQSVHIPAYGGVLTPYRWMLRESAWTLAEGLGLEASEGQEPQEGQAPALIVNTAWVQDCDNQRALLEGFRRDLSEEDSLVFFYAKQTPLTDSHSRQIVAVAKLSTIHHVDEYPYEGGSAAGRIRSMIWERPFQHSLRPDSQQEGVWQGGVVLPYHQLLAHAQTNEIALEPFIATVPAEAYEQFLYGSEHVSHGSAITALQAVRTALEATSEVLPGPWEQYIGWIDRELGALWTMQGPTPGLGSALSCFDPNFNGTLFAHALAAELEDSADPWPIIDAIFDGSREAPARAPKITKMNRMRWQHLRKDAESYELVRLLAAFELTKEQAIGAFEEGDAPSLLANPYRLFEGARTSAQPISLTTIDRSLFPTDVKSAAPDLPDAVEVDLDEPEDPLRLRAIAVEALERAASVGDTVLSAERLNEAISALPLTRPVTLDATTLEICQTEFEPEVRVTKEDGRVFAQLIRYQRAGEVIRAHVGERAAAASPSAKVDWAPLVEAEFGAEGAGGIDEAAARKEKVAALKMLERSRIGVLTGPAGTGKTTLLKIFLNQQSVVGRDLQLLAPTGKARVRLGQQTGRPAQARTLAQFLLEHERYDSETGRYFVLDEGPTASVTTCVVDESSMLTEDQLAALCSALPKDARLILVGDPQQLPPIGAGRPFVDIIAQLRDKGKGVGVADLTVSRRQAGGDLVPALSLPDVQLASLFSGGSLPPGEDEVISAAGTPQDSDRLRFVTWDTPGTLRERLLDVLSDELQAERAELEPALEMSLGGTPNGDYIYFNRGCGLEAESWQILSAHRNQASGSAEINRFLKQTVRRERLEKARTRGRGWRMIKPRGADQITYGDKVICLRNHRRNRWSPGGGKRQGYLANGEVGIVTGEAGSGRALKFTNVEFASQPDDTYSFRESDFSEEGSPYLELAYAVTVHKAQGSEFGTVILILPEKSQLLSREMLYTALTRQENRVWVLHQGPFSHYLRLRSDFFSETKRRSTNLFGAPAMHEVSFAGPGGVRTGWLADKLIHATRRGDLVSSKSELVIADILHDIERQGLIRYSFEKPLTDAKGETRLPDFTIEKGTDKWFWEHCGMLSQPQYAERWEKKLLWYAAQGISAWSEANPDGRLLVTVDKPDGGFDSGAIHSLAKRLFC